MTEPMSDQRKSPESVPKGTEQKATHFCERLMSHFEEKGVMICLSGMTIFYSLTMVSRYITGISVSWADELVNFFFIWAVFLGASIGAKRGAHLGVSVIHDSVPPKLRKYFVVAISICSVFTCSIMAWEGIGMVHLQYTMDQRSSQIGLPIFLVGLSVPVGLLFCVIRFIQAFFQKLRQSSATRSQAR